MRRRSWLLVVVSLVTGCCALVILWYGTAETDPAVSGAFDALTLTNAFPAVVAMGAGLFLIAAVVLFREFGKISESFAHLRPARPVTAPDRNPLHAVIRHEARPSAVDKPVSRSTNVRAPVRVLVVDDNDLNLAAAHNLLQLEHICADTARSGGEALEMVAAAHYAIVFMDIDMPGLSGTETTRRIRMLPGENGRMPVIALTATVGAGDKTRYLEAGMNGVLPKPVTRDRIRAILDTWLPDGGTDTGGGRTDRER